MAAFIVSAAIIEGNLTIGLSDGTLIFCGYVQGPPGIKGDTGPMGANGDAGRDGNTILTVGGTPRNDVGTDGDYAIDNINWRIFGPKSGGVWGKANEMLPSKSSLITNGQAPSAGGGSIGGGGSAEGGGGGTMQTTATLPLANPTRFPQIKSLPDSSNLKSQSDMNKWVYECLSSGAGSSDPDLVEYVKSLEVRVETLEKAIMPWVEFTDNYRTCSYKAGSTYTDASVRMYQYWSVSSAGSWNWAWMVKFPGEEWVDIDDLADEKAASIGFRGESTRDGVYVYLYPPDEDDMIDIELSLKITNTVEGFEPAVGWSEPFWPKATWIGKGSSDVGYSVRSKSGVGQTYTGITI